jgi:hypothetical protein
MELLEKLDQLESDKQALSEGQLAAAADGEGATVRELSAQLASR